MNTPLLILLVSLASTSVLGNVQALKSNDSKSLFIINETGVRKLPIDLERFKADGNVLLGEVTLPRLDLTQEFPSNKNISEHEFVRRLKLIASMIGKSPVEWDKNFGFKEYHTFCLTSAFGVRTDVPSDLDCKKSTSDLCTPSIPNLKSCLKDRASNLMSFYRLNPDILATSPAGYGLATNPNDWWASSISGIGLNVKIEAGAEKDCRPIYKKSSESNAIADRTKFSCSLLKQYAEVLKSIGHGTNEDPRELIQSSPGSLEQTVPAGTPGLSEVRLGLYAANGIALDLPYDGLTGAELLNPESGSSLVLENRIPLIEYDRTLMEKSIHGINTLDSLESKITLLQKIVVAKKNAEVIRAIQSKYGVQSLKVFSKRVLGSLYGEYLDYEKAELEVVSMMTSKLPEVGSKEILTIKRVIKFN